VGSYIMLPAGKTIVTTSAVITNTRNGIFKSNFSRHQNVEFSMKYYTKQSDFKDGGKVNLSQNYGATLKVIGKKKYKPTIALSISNSSSIEFKNTSSLLVDLRPSYDLSLQADLLSKNKINVGPILALTEESNIDYTAGSFHTRRDRDLWLGVQASTSFSLKKTTLTIFSSLKSNIYSNNLEQYDKNNLLRFEVGSRINLTSDYYLSVFYNNESLDRTSDSIGMNFTYQL
jgi:hypothetical protein